VLRPPHPILPDTAASTVVVQHETPESYRHWPSGDGLPSQLPSVAVHENDPEPVGVVVRADDEFRRLPGCEPLVDGLNTKGMHYVALARQARFLTWGFNAPPDELTEFGRQLFLNAVEYIAGFGGEEPVVFRVASPRYEVFHYHDTFQGNRAMFAQQGRSEDEYAALFAGMVDVAGFTDALRGDDNAWQAWWDAHEPYLRMDGRVCVVDEDARALGIPNNDPRIVERAIDLLERGDAGERELAARVLARSTAESFDGARDWRAWWERAGDSLVFSDWGGYRFVWEGGPTAPPPPDAVRAEGSPVTLTLDVLAGTAYVQVDVDPGKWLYAPDSDEGVPMSVTGASVVGEPRFPPTDDGHLQGRFGIEVPIERGADGITLDVRYQACDEFSCAMPVTVTLRRP
jgi:hypothetical protein